MNRAGERPVVMVPGLGLGPEAWAPTIRGLSSTTVVPVQATVVTLPGYGRPVGPQDPIDPRGAARRLLDTGLPAGDEVLLLGHSSSCQAVMHAAVLAPERVAGLLLVGPTTDPRAATWPRLVRRWLATAARETPRQVPSLVRQYRRTGLRHMLRVMDVARHDRVDCLLDDIRCPIQVVRGPHDRIAPADWCARLGPTVTLPAGGHMVPFTHGDLLAHHVRDVVESLPPAF